jgi:tetratricopeptide (TPR) repeat protein
MRWRRLPARTLTVLFCLVVSLAYAEPESQAARDQAILRIQQLIESGDLPAARGLLTKSAKQFPADAGLDNLSGIIEAQEGHYAPAEASFKRAIQRQPRFTGAYLNLGRLYQENSVDRQARDKALDIYQRVLNYDAENAEANYQSATLLLQNGDFKESLTRWLRLPTHTQESAQALSIVCADYAALGDRKRTDDAVARLLASPDFSEPDARQMLPGLRAGKRDDVIISVLESLQKSLPLSPDMQYSLGLAYEAADRLNDARSTLEQFVTGGHLSVASLLVLARVAHEQKDYKGSLGYLAHARDLEPDNASIHYWFGLVCLDLDLIAEARNSFEKAVKLEPENPSYNYAMGTVSAFQHDPEEAVPYFEKYLRLKPQDQRGKLALGVAFFLAKDYDAAAPWLADAVKIPETATTAHYYLGSLALQQGRLDEAADQLKLALNASPNYADALAELGQYYLLRKDYGRSEKQLRRALEIDPNHFSANFYLLTLYTRTGDSRREAQAKRYDDLQKLRQEKSQEFLRMVEVRPFDTP